MPAKGSGGKCCCGGCAQVPRDDSIGDLGALQPIQQYCCACMPKQICVTYTGPLGTYTGLLDVIQPCTPGDTVTSWRGDIGVNSDVTDLDFTWVVENETCYLELSSTALGVTSNRVEINSSNRNRICPRCRTCHGLTIDFDLGGGVSIKIRPAGNASIPRQKNCCDCSDPCAPGETTEEPCFPHCGGCGCICEAACIYVLEDGQPASNAVGNLCNWEWTAAGMTVELVNVDGCCMLSLTNVTGYTPDADPANVAIDDISNPCPRPTASWAFTDTVTGKAITVLFTCSGCGGCDTILNTCGCAAPRILTASVSGCCGSFDVVLFYDDASAIWSGSADAWCIGTLVLELSCDGNNWVLGASADNCVDNAANSEIEGNHDTEDCDPFDLDFSLDFFDENPGVGPFCCDPVESPTGTTINITIT